MEKWIVILSFFSRRFATAFEVFQITVKKLLTEYSTYSVESEAELMPSLASLLCLSSWQLPACLPIYLSVCLTDWFLVYLLDRMIIRLLVCASVWAHLSVCLRVCLSECLFVCFLVYLSACLKDCLCACLSVYLFVCLSVCLSKEESYRINDAVTDLLRWWQQEREKASFSYVAK